MKEFTNSVVDAKQKEASARLMKAQGGGHPNKKQRTNGNINSGSISKRQTMKLAAAVVKLGKEEEKETSKFDKGIEKIPVLLVNSSMSAQKRGIEGEVTPSNDANKRKEKMSEVAVMLKSFICNPRGKQSNKENGDDEDL